MTRYDTDNTNTFSVGLMNKGFRHKRNVFCKCISLLTLIKLLRVRKYMPFIDKNGMCVYFLKIILFYFLCCWTNITRKQKKKSFGV